MKWEWKRPKNDWADAEPIHSKNLDGSATHVDAALEWARGYRNAEYDIYPDDHAKYTVDIRRTHRRVSEARRVKVWALVRISFSAHMDTEEIAATDEVSE